MWKEDKWETELIEKNININYPQLFLTLYDRQTLILLLFLKK